MLLLGGLVIPSVLFHVRQDISTHCGQCLNASLGGINAFVGSVFHHLRRLVREFLGFFACVFDDLFNDGGCSFDTSLASLDCFFAGFCCYGGCFSGSVRRLCCGFSNNLKNIRGNVLQISLVHVLHFALHLESDWSYIESSRAEWPMPPCGRFACQNWLD